ncbi:hypothetical protein V5735_16640 (plasmid) [Haladaptatus sp. SPP-AMP-3]
MENGKKEGAKNGMRRTAEMKGLSGGIRESKPGIGKTTEIVELIRP